MLVEENAQENYNLLPAPVSDQSQNGMTALPDWVMGLNMEPTMVKMRHFTA